MQRTEISAEEQAEIIRDYVSGQRKDAIAEKYHIARDRVSAICAGEERVVVCTECGREFCLRDGEKLRKFCTLECRAKHFNKIQRMNRASARQAKKAAKPIPRRLTLDEKIRAADAAGLSYGQYVMMQRLKEARNG